VQPRGDSVEATGQGRAEGETVNRERRELAGGEAGEEGDDGVPAAGHGAIGLDHAGAGEPGGRRDGIEEPRAAGLADGYEVDGAGGVQEGRNRLEPGAGPAVRVMEKNWPRHSHGSHLPPRVGILRIFSWRSTRPWMRASALGGQPGT